MLSTLWESKKFRSALVGSIIQLLVVIVAGIFSMLGHTIDPAILFAALAGIASQFGIQIGAQGYADGKSHGMTSSSAKGIQQIINGTEARKGVRP